METKNREEMINCWLSGKLLNSMLDMSLSALGHANTCKDILQVFEYNIVAMTIWV